MEAKGRDSEVEGGFYACEGMVSESASPTKAPKHQR